MKIEKESVEINNRIKWHNTSARYVQRERIEQIVANEKNKIKETAQTYNNNMFG